MHHALCIEEILLNIFHNLHIPRGRQSHSGYVNAHLAVLARTCRAFKEPALDLIWSELDDLAPLIRCLRSELWATCEQAEHGTGLLYSVKQPLRKSDWDIILSYAHRVRGLRRLRGSFGLNADSIQALSNPPGSTRSIFPNIRVVGVHVPTATIAPLVQHLITPTVTNVSLEYVDAVGSTIYALGKECPYVTDFTVSQSAQSDTISDLIRHWHNLSSVHCYDVGLNVDSLLHLSRSRNLHRLSFRVHDVVVNEIQAAQSSPTILTFSALHGLHLNSPFLIPIGWLLYHLRVPLLQNISVGLHTRPTAPDLMVFFTGLQETCTHTSLSQIYLRAYHNGQSDILSMENSRPYYLTFDRLRPLTMFSNIKSITLDIPCGVDLSERNLLTLTSSWPHLVKFEVGENYDWAPSSGITPGGFLQLLEQCRSLKVFFFVFDTRGYNEIPRGDPWRGLRMPKNTFLHLLNSPIEEESIQALGVFFHAAPYPDFSLTTHWNYQYYRGSLRPQELCDTYYDRWVRARELARDISEKRRNMVHSLGLDARF